VVFLVPPQRMYRKGPFRYISATKLPLSKSFQGTPTSTFFRLKHRFRSTCWFQQGRTMECGYGRRLKRHSIPFAVTTIVAGLENCRKQICNFLCVPSLFWLFSADYLHRACHHPRQCTLFGALFYLRACSILSAPVSAVRLAKVSISLQREGDILSAPPTRGTRPTSPSDQARREDMKMETTQSPSASRPASSKVSPLKQHPIMPALPPSPPSPSDATRTVFLDHPSARLSSSPASSARIVDPLPTRRGSVYPAMSETMEGGLIPGADFFDDCSSDSGWEDSEGDITQTLTAGEDFGMRSLVHGMGGKDTNAGRGRSWQRSTITALPSFPLPVHDSGLGIDYDEASSPLDGKGASRARQMSLRRLNKDNVRLVHTRSSGGRPRDSLRSNDSDAASAIADLSKPYPFPNLQHNEDTPRPYLKARPSKAAIGETLPRT
jgi:hypothetical protein